MPTYSQQTVVQELVTCDAGDFSSSNAEAEVSITIGSIAITKEPSNEVNSNGEFEANFQFDGNTADVKIDNTNPNNGFVIIFNNAPSAPIKDNATVKVTLTIPSTDFGFKNLGLGGGEHGITSELADGFPAGIEYVEAESDASKQVIKFSQPTADNKSPFIVFSVNIYNTTTNYGYSCDPGGRPKRQP